MNVRCILLAAITAMVAGSTACDGSPARTNPLVELSPLPPDTGNLGLLPVSGSSAITLVDDSVIKDPVLIARIAKRRAESRTVVARVARVADDLNSNLALGSNIAFDVSPSRRLVYSIDRFSEQMKGYPVWQGRLQGGLYGELTLVKSADGITAGIRVFGPPYASYQLEPLSTQYVLIIYVDTRNMPLD